jgi:hypothetical protein
VLKRLAGRYNWLGHRADSLVNAPFGAMKTWLSTPQKHFCSNLVDGEVEKQERVLNRRVGPPPRAPILIS